MVVFRGGIALSMGLMAAGCLADFGAEALCSAAREGEPCGAAGAGRCRGGECCGGCFDGARCRGGSETTACGAVGAMCVACDRGERCAEGECLPATVVRSIATASSTACAIDEAGRLFCWGSNRGGKTGVGTEDLSVGQPTQVVPGSVWTDVSTSWAWQGHGCGVQRDGSAWCWGTNAAGELGTGTLEATNAPVAVAPDGGPPFRDVGVTSQASCGLRQGSLWCWGSLVGYRAIHGREAAAFPMQLVPLRYDGGEDYASVTMGDGFGCALHESGIGDCWGTNDRGQLGRDTGGEPAPPGPIGDGYSAISAGAAHACGIKAGLVFCWGANETGQTGQSPAPFVAAPTPLGDGRSYRAVAAGDAHTCAIDDAGQLLCWGDNAYGQLGLGEERVGEVIHEPQPVAVSRAWLAVAAGTQFTCALTDAGTLYCWGSDGQGQQATPGSTQPVPAPNVVALPVPM